MTVSFLRIVEHIHGHIGWLTVALLVHPAFLLRKKNRRAHLAVGLATAAPLITAAMGISLYEPYRTILKAHIFQEAPQIGLLFERKEHLAFTVVVLTLTASISYFSSWRAEGTVRERLHVLSHRTFVLAALLAIAVACLGTYVASYRTF